MPCTAGRGGRKVEERSMDKQGYELPTCRINTTNDKNEICSIMKACDAAFEEPVSEREIYPELLRKICRNGIFAFACQEKPVAYCASTQTMQIL